MRQDESVEIGYWDPEGLHAADNEKERESYLYKSIEQKKFKISTKLVSNTQSVRIKKLLIKIYRYILMKIRVQFLQLERNL